MRFEEVLDLITRAQQRIAVLSSVIDSLEKYLPSDLEDGAEEVIRVSEQCLQPDVPPELVEEVVEELSKMMEDTEAELSGLRSMSVSKPAAKKRRTKKQ